MSFTRPLWGGFVFLEMSFLNILKLCRIAFRSTSIHVRKPEWLSSGETKVGKLLPPLFPCIGEILSQKQKNRHAVSRHHRLTPLSSETGHQRKHRRGGATQP